MKHMRNLVKIKHYKSSYSIYDFLKGETSVPLSVILKGNGITTTQIYIWQIYTNTHIGMHIYIIDKYNTSLPEKCYPFVLPEFLRYFPKGMPEKKIS